MKEKIEKQKSDLENSIDLAKRLVKYFPPLFVGGSVRMRKYNLPEDLINDVDIFTEDRGSYNKATQFLKDEGFNVTVRSDGYSDVYKSVCTKEGFKAIHLVNESKLTNWDDEKILQYWISNVLKNKESKYLKKIRAILNIQPATNVDFTKLLKDYDFKKREGDWYLDLKVTGGAWLLVYDAIKEIRLLVGNNDFQIDLQFTNNEEVDQFIKSFPVYSDDK